ncbi:MAG: PadR family transcriptional regulator [Dermatophilaceae bacterium]
MSPVFAHGQLRLYLLALLEEGPRHGYEVIQDLEQRFGGLYIPSAGTVYPRLAKLEEEGLVERSDDGRKATYSITEAGRAEVAARRFEIDSLQRDLDNSVRQLADEVRTRVHGSSADLRAELRAAARQARATATPAGSAAAGNDWPARKGEFVDLERAVNDLRSQARRAWRRHGLTQEQTTEIATIISEASRRIGDVMGRR